MRLIFATNLLLKCNCALTKITIKIPVKSWVLHPCSKLDRPANEHYSATSSKTKLLHFHLMTHWSMNWMMTRQTFSAPHHLHFTTAYSDQHSHYTQLWALTAPGLRSTLWNKLPSSLLSAVQNIPFLYDVAKSIQNYIHTATATSGGFPTGLIPFCEFQGDISSLSWEVWSHRHAGYYQVYLASHIRICSMFWSSSEWRTAKIICHLPRKWPTAKVRSLSEQCIIFHVKQLFNLYIGYLEIHIFYHFIRAELIPLHMPKLVPKVKAAQSLAFHFGCPLPRY